MTQVPEEKRGLTEKLGEKLEQVGEDLQKEPANIDVPPPGGYRDPDDRDNIQRSSE